MACNGIWWRVARVKREHLRRKVILYIKIIVKDELDYAHTRAKRKEYSERIIKEMANNRVQQRVQRGVCKSNKSGL